MHILLARRSFIAYPTPDELDRIKALAASFHQTPEELVCAWLASLAKYHSFLYTNELEPEGLNAMNVKTTKTGLALHPTADESAVLQSLADAHNVSPQALVSHWLQRLLTSDESKYLAPPQATDPTDPDHHPMTDPADLIV